MTPRINTARVIVGGLLAGAAIIVFNLAAQLALGARVQEEMNTWMPGAAGRMQPGAAAAAAGLAMKVVLGTILVWLYAAARARFGPGPKTALRIAVPVWLLGAVFFSDFPLTGMISWTTYALLEGLQLMAFAAAALAGAWLYREP